MTVQDGAVRETGRLKVLGLQGKRVPAIVLLPAVFIVAWMTWGVATVPRETQWQKDVRRSTRPAYSTPALPQPRSASRVCWWRGIPYRMCLGPGVPF